MRVSRSVFGEIVASAFARIPEHIRNRFRNVAIIVEDAPTPAQLRECDVPSHETLYGYYDGVPLTEREGDGEPTLPDRVYIFQCPLEEDCATPEELTEEVERTIRHELAHHLGIEDDRLEELGKY
ncbi:metallopeptidase family protein [Candidatus Uhrbacteria bacterium]|nr:metallopeptidase family protein [Candidatus Uhrbacteria bacterium]